MKVDEVLRNRNIIWKLVRLIEYYIERNGQ